MANLATNPTPELIEPYEGLEPGQTEVAPMRIGGPQFAVDYEMPREVCYGRQTLEYERLVRATPRLKSALRILEDATFWVPATVKSAYGEGEDYPAHYAARDAEVIPVVDLQLKTFRQTYGPFRDQLRSWLHYALVCGYGVAEKVWAPVQGYWRLVALKTKKPWDFSPYVDEWGNLIALYHYATGKYLNPERFLFAAWPYLHGENYLGISEVEAVRQDVALLASNRQARARYIHKVSITPLVWEHDAALSPADRLAVEDVLKRLDSETVLELPARKGPDGQLVSSHKFEGMVDRASQPMLAALQQAISYDGDELTQSLGIPATLVAGGSTGTSGTFALGRVQFDTFTARPETMQEFLSVHVSQQVVREIVRFNWPLYLTDDYRTPIYAFDLIDEDFESRQSERVIKEVQAGIRTPAEARAVIGLPTIDTDEGANTQQFNGAQLEQWRAVLTDAAAGAIPRESAAEFLINGIGLPADVAEKALANIGKGFEAAAPVAYTG